MAKKTLPESYYVLETDLSKTDYSDRTTYINLLKTDADKLFDDIDNKYGGMTLNAADPDNINLVDDNEPISYYTSGNSDNAVNNVGNAQTALDKESSASLSGPGSTDITELEMRANRLHYFTYFILFIVAITYTIRLYTLGKNDALESFILLVAALIVLYYLVKFLVDYYRNKQ